MAIPSLSGSYIDETYQRLVQISGSEYADGLGNPISFGGGPGGTINSIQINRDGTNFTGSANLTFVNNNIQLTGSILMSGSSYISGVDYLQFDTTAVNTSAVGKLYWNDVDGTLELGLKGGTVRSELGQGLVTRVVNKTSPLVDLAASDYQVVVVSGAQGQRLAVKLAQGNNDANSAGTLGIVAEDIARNQEGFVVTVGLLKNRDTTGALQGETWNDGDILYLSPTIAGAITNIKPQAPNHTVIVGYVEYAHQNNGKIYVKIDNGYEIDELHNVKINGVQHGDLLMYDTNVWYNTKQLSGSYSITGSLTISGSLTTNDGVCVNSLTASTISASSIVGYVPNTATGSFVINSQTSSFVLNSQTSSFATTGSNDFIGNQTITGSLTVSGSSTFTNIGPAIFSGSVTSIAGFTGSFSGSVFGYVPNEATGSFINNSQTSSFITNNQTGSFVTNTQTGSFITNNQTSSFVTNNQTSSFVTNQQTSSFVLNTQTGSMLQPYALSSQLNSYLTTGSQNVNQTISGSLTISENLIVLGSSSVTFISSSTLNIGTNLITVNTINPTNRYGGLAIIDSGSSPLVSASFLYDSVQDEFVFVHKGDGTNVTSSHFLVGPETYNKLGDEIYVGANLLLKSQGNEHVTSSNITDTGIIVSINSNTEVTGGLNVSAGITGSLFGTADTASYVNGSIFGTNNLVTSASYALTASYGIIAANGTSLYSTTPAAGLPNINNAQNSIFLGNNAGVGANNAANSNFFGENAGNGANFGVGSNFFGQNAGNQATNAIFSNFIGISAGNSATNGRESNFIGGDAGSSATYASSSVFIGNGAGAAGVYSFNSTFLGHSAGGYANSSSYSTFVGYRAGYNATPLAGQLKSNNIIIGSNITLPYDRQDSINIGGIIFGTGSYSTMTGNPYSGSSNGSIGINTINPQYTLDVSGSGNFTNGLIVTGGITGSFSGSVVGYVPNEATTSFVTNQQTSSFVTTSSFNSFTSSINSFTQSILSWTGSVITNTQTSSMYVYSSSFATTASYIEPQFISASAAASGFGGSSGLTYSQVQRLIALGM